MNQILNTKLKEKRKLDKNFFKFQFTISIFISFILICVIIYYIFSLQKKEKISNNLIGNYNIYKLYSNVSQEDYVEEKEQSENEIFGIIEIPKIDIRYPIFSHLSEELLKISPCKFYGQSPKENGNICIAGHNYNNSMFFSNLSRLNKNDEIYLYDNSNNKYTYTIFNLYEVKESDLSPIFDYNQSSKELTLITCNNINLNRVIIKAKQ
jgi:LPXTG-site transpeptidase (sortase) family protein